MVDHLGYLWISTYTGIARYNGYELKDYDLSKGFSTREIWRTFEDKSGKIWLYSISSYLGYIYKNEYHKAYDLVDTNSSFYPRYQMQDTKDGICFINIVPHKTDYSFIKVRNDTIVSKTYLGYFGLLSKIIDENHVLTLRDSGYVYMTTIEGTKSTSRKVGSFTFVDFPPDVQYHLGQFIIGNSTLFGKYLLSISSRQDAIAILNFENFSATSSDTKKLLHTKEIENVTYLFHDQNYLLAFTDSIAYWLDTNLNVVKQKKLDSLVNDGKNVNISLCQSNVLWNNVIATNNHGIYLDFGKDTVFRKVKVLDIKDYTYLGCVSDTISYWYNRLANKIAKVVKNNQVTYSSIKLKDIYSVIYYSNDTGLLLTNEFVYKFDYKTFQLSKYTPFGAYRLFPIAKDSFIGTQKYFGLFKSGITFSSREIFHRDRFKEMIFDSTRNLYWMFNSGKILQYSSATGTKSFISRDLTSMGINNIENLMVDQKFGNIFILEDKRLLMFDDINKPYQLLFSNFIYDNSYARFYKGKLIVAGNFGVFFCKILGKGKLSAPVFYPNKKKILYYRVNNAEVYNNQVILNTDKGVFIVNIPPDEEFDLEREKSLDSYRFVLTYNDLMYGIKGGRDTIIVSQLNNKILFDIIKPDGSGQVKYLYSLLENDTSWTSLNENELNLPKLNAGQYYHLRVIAYDNQWKSSPNDICLYITPFWYQTPLGQFTLWCSILALIVAIIYIIVIVTKRIVTRHTEEKQAQLELELKSVYSQLNPHFIFNSLGAAMYLVKKNRTEDAYKHIYKFSQLLRSYIKSSRNRFIPLSEEIVNLENYIELQQSRFKDKFEFEIIVEVGLNTAISIPSLLIQPLVENAITHGLLPKESVGHIKIEFKKGEGPRDIIGIIEDNGIGRKEALLMKEQNNLKQESYGSLLIKDLIRILNKYEEVNIDLEYIDKTEPESGTIVKLNIKNLSK